MAKGYKDWVMKQEGRKEPVPSVQHYPLNDYLKGRLEPSKWGEIEEGKLGWVWKAFIWRDTPQGFNFWSDVPGGRGDQSLACDILRSWKEQVETL